MAIDETLLLKTAQNSAPPVLRFYSWNPPALSVGYHQKVAERFDLAECRRRGIDIVRRPTGGREVLHLGELTYAFCISRVSLSQIEAGFRSSMQLLGTVFQRGLELLGVVPQRIALGRAGKGAKRTDKLPRQPCFVSMSQYEVSVDGRKLIGSAQKSAPGGFLQHGSILLTSEGLDVVELLSSAGENRVALKEAFRRKATDLREVLNREVSATEVISVLKEAFSSSLDFEVVDSELEPQELSTGVQLQREKYESRGWYYPAVENSRGHN
jgi:lipoate-protein ligase A